MVAWSRSRVVPRTVRTLETATHLTQMQVKQAVGRVQCRVVHA